MSKLSVTVADPGKGAPPNFWTKLRPEGPKKLFLETASPPPPYLRVWMSPPYLKLWIWQCVILLFNGLSKQKVLFSSTICYLRLAECFFHFLHDSLCKTIDLQLMNKLPVIYLLLCYTIYCGIQCNVVIRFVRRF